jgi:Zn-dependent protease with chaperone function
MEFPLTPRSLTLKRERVYFRILFFFSCLVWLVFTVTIFPVVVLLIVGFVLWIVHGLLVARIKSEGVRLDAQQMPELSRVFANVCGKLNAKSIPELYLMQHGGILNAFATRHCARDFVVLYSDLLEAYGAESDEIKFLLGHEIGHIQSRHIFKTVLLLPGLFLPLLGSAYNRACESSCDRHGAFASDKVESSVRAVMILSGGKQAGRELIADAFASQHLHSRGFFISLHELFSGYPTLSKRVSDLLDIEHHRTTPKPARNPLAVLLGLFCPGARFGVMGVLLVFYFIMISVSVAIPAFVKAREHAQAAIQSKEKGTSSPSYPRGSPARGFEKEPDYIKRLKEWDAKKP